MIDPAQYVPLSATRAGEAHSAVSLIIQGLGQDPSLFVDNPNLAPNWEKLENMSLEELLGLYDKGWEYLENFAAGKLTDNTRGT